MFKKKGPKEGETPRNKHDEKIMEAVIVGDAPKLRTLLKASKHTSLTTPDDEGRVPIYEACRLGLHEIAELLMSAQPDATCQDEEGRTPLHVATEKGFQQCVQVLLKKGTSPNAFDQRNQTPLHLAASTGNVDILETLLAFQAETEIPDRDGNTPLLCACKYNQLQTATKLLNGSANANAVNRAAKTALMFGCEHGNKELVKLLLGRGAIPDKRDTAGRTARAYAVMNNHSAVIELLPDDVPLPGAGPVDAAPMRRSSSASRMKKGDDYEKLKKELQTEKDKNIKLNDEITLLREKIAALHTGPDDDEEVTFSDDEDIDLGLETKSEKEKEKDKSRRSLPQSSELQTLKAKLAGLDERNQELQHQMASHASLGDDANTEIVALRSKIENLEETLEEHGGGIPVVPMSLIEQTKADYSQRVADLTQTLEAAKSRDNRGGDMKRIRSHYDHLLGTYRAALLMALKGSLSSEAKNLLLEISDASSS